MTFKKLACVAALSCGVAAFGAEQSKLQKLNGTWTAQDAGSDGATTWIFTEKGDDSLKVTRLRGSEKISDFECNTMGKDCDLKDAGKKAKVSMWFLGPKLVQVESKGSEVIKRRFAVDDQGENMEMEVIPISPGGKAETIHYKHIQTAAHNQ